MASVPTEAAPEQSFEFAESGTFATEHQISALMFAVWEAAPRTSCKIEEGGMVNVENSQIKLN